MSPPREYLEGDYSSVLQTKMVTYIINDCPERGYVVFIRGKCDSWACGNLKRKTVVYEAGMATVVDEDVLLQG